MSIVHLSDELKQIIERQVAHGRVADESTFLAAAVSHYAAALEHGDVELLDAADEGARDIEAGRFELIEGHEGVVRLATALSSELTGMSASEPLTRGR